MTGLCGQGIDSSIRLQQSLPGTGIFPANLLTLKSLNQIRDVVCTQNN